MLRTLSKNSTRNVTGYTTPVYESKLVALPVLPTGISSLESGSYKVSVLSDVGEDFLNFVCGSDKISDVEKDFLNFFSGALFFTSEPDVYGGEMS